MGVGAAFCSVWDDTIWWARGGLWASAWAAWVWALRSAPCGTTRSGGREAACGRALGQHGCGRCVLLRVGRHDLVGARRLVGERLGSMGVGAAFCSVWDDTIWWARGGLWASAWAAWVW